MKGMIFLDDNFREVKVPKETCDKEEFKDFIHKVFYIFFNIPERMQWFNRMFYKHDEMNSIFNKTKPGVYSYDEENDYWYSEIDENVIAKVEYKYYKAAEMRE